LVTEAPVVARPVSLVWRSLTFPTGFDAAQALTWCRLLVMRPLHGWWRRPDPVVIEVSATRTTGLRWRIGTTPREAGLLVPQLRAQLAGIGTAPADRDLPDVTHVLELRLDCQTRPLRTDTAEAVAASALTAIGGVHGSEALVLSWLVGPWLARPAVAAGQPAGLFRPPLAAEEATAWRQKMTEPLLGVVGRIGVAAATPARGVQLAQRVLGALQLTRAPGAGFVTRRTSGTAGARRLVDVRVPVFGWPCHLAADELAVVLGWPIGNPHLADVSYRGHVQLPPPPRNTISEATAAKAPPGTYRVLGRATYPTSQPGLVHLPIGDAVHHLHVVGPTGTGKSVLLAHLIEADIAAGRSVVVVEPKADLVAAVLDRIPADRADDVVLIDPTDPTHAVGIDVLAGPNPELAADRFVHVVRSLWRESWGPRTAQVLHAGALTLARAGETLTELPLLLSDRTYRARLLAAHPDPLGTGPFWAWFDTLSKGEHASVVGPSVNRLSAFVGRSCIRAVIGQPSPRFALADAVTTERRVVLVNLARGLIGPESARLLGGLLLSQLWQATLARAGTPADQRPPVGVYVDEFQDYVTGLPVDFSEVLAQARGLGLALTLAHQGLHQLDAATRAAVLSGARSRIVFQTTSPDTDTRALAAVLDRDRIAPADLAALGAFEAYATVMSRHRAHPPASIVTLPPSDPSGTTEAVREYSRAQWARPIADVDAAILARRHSPRAASAPVGRRPRRRTP
jgi:hypothetical protein